MHKLRTLFKKFAYLGPGGKTPPSPAQPRIPARKDLPLKTLPKTQPNLLIFLPQPNLLIFLPQPNLLIFLPQPLPAPLSYFPQYQEDLICYVFKLVWHLPSETPKFRHFVQHYKDFSAPFQSELDMVLEVYTRWGFLQGLSSSTMRLFYKLFTLFIVLRKCFSPYSWAYYNILGDDQTWYSLSLNGLVEQCGSNLFLPLTYFTKDLLKRVNFVPSYLKLPKKWRELSPELQEDLYRLKNEFCAIFYTFSNSRDCVLFIRGKGTTIYGQTPASLDRLLTTRFFKPGYHLAISRSFFLLGESFIQNDKIVLVNPSLVRQKPMIMRQSDMGSNKFFYKPGIFIEKTLNVNFNSTSFTNPLLEAEVDRAQLGRVLGIVNYLNQTRCLVDHKLLKRFIGYSSSPFFSNIGETLSRSLGYRTYFNSIGLRVKKHLVEIQDQNTQEKELKNQLRRIQKASSYAELEEELKIQEGVTAYVRNVAIEKELQGLDYFYMNFVFDRRFRIYSYQQPVNYQLYHFVRALVKLTPQPLHLAAANLLDIIDRQVMRLLDPEDREGFRYFHAQKISQEGCDKIFGKLLELKTLTPKLKFRLGLYIKAKDTKDLVRTQYIQEALYFQWFLDLCDKLRSGWSPNLEDRILSGLEVLTKLRKLAPRISNKERTFTPELEHKAVAEALALVRTKARKLFSGLGFIVNLSQWFVSSEDYFQGMVESDGTANAAQLVGLRSFIYDEKCLRILNIWDNTEKFSDIYTYAADWVSNSLYKPGSMEGPKNLTPTRVSLPQELLNTGAKVVDRDLMKEIIMPQIYGQTESEAVGKVRTRLKTLTLNLPLTDRQIQQLSKFILARINSALLAINFNFQDHILVVKGLARMLKQDFIWLSDYSLLVNTLKLTPNSAQKVIEKQGNLQKDTQILGLLTKIFDEFESEGILPTQEKVSRFMKLKYPDLDKFEQGLRDKFLTRLYKAKPLEYDLLLFNAEQDRLTGVTKLKTSLKARNFKLSDLGELLSNINADPENYPPKLAKELRKLITIQAQVPRERLDRMIARVAKAKDKCKQKIWRCTVEVFTDKKTKVKTTFWKAAAEIDWASLFTGSTANTTHQRDSGISLRVVEFCAFYNIPVLTIHDAFYTSWEYSLHVKLLFKVALIESLIRDKKTTAFPYNHISKLSDHIEGLDDPSWFYKHDIEDKAWALAEQINTNKAKYNSKFFLEILNSTNLLS